MSIWNQPVGLMEFLVSIADTTASGRLSRGGFTLARTAESNLRSEREP
jgi:hypothetical protein